MAASPDNIPTDLAFEITASKLPPDTFIRAVRHFVDVVQEVANALAGPDQTIEWNLLVHEGSAIVALEPWRYSVPMSLIDSIKDRLRDGIDELESEATEPSSFSEKAIKAAHDLAKLVGTTDEDDTRVRIWIRRKPKQLTHHVVAHAAELLKETYEDYGTVEGRLQLLSEHGVLHCEVRDPVTNRRIRCIIEEAQLPAMLAAFRKRIEVSGPIRYRRDGTPVSITEFPDQSSLPSAHEVRGILKERA